MDFETEIYRMVQLGEFDLVEKKTQLRNFPALFTGLVQVKVNLLKLNQIKLTFSNVTT